MPCNLVQNWSKNQTVKGRFTFGIWNSIWKQAGESQGKVLAIPSKFVVDNNEHINYKRKVRYKPAISQIVWTNEGNAGMTD